MEMEFRGLQAANTRDTSEKALHQATMSAVYWNFVFIEKGSKFRSMFPTFALIEYLVFRQATTGL